MNARLACLAVLLCAPALAQEVTVYQCTDASGLVTMQTHAPCPADTAQRIRIIDVPPPVTLQPAHVLPRVAPAADRASVPPAADADDAAPAAPRTPPQPLFLCQTFDAQQYFSPTDTPPPRCRPLQTVGIGGMPGMGAGQACERVRDTCEPVADDALCRAWDSRVREAEFRWRYAASHQEAGQLHAQFQALSATYQASTCAGD